MMSILKKIKSLVPLIIEKRGAHKYYIWGNKKDYRLSGFKKSYSQDGEDMLLISLYEDIPDYKGFYLDIGVHDPIRYSNTHFFYEKGWRGINIDATPGSMKRFEELRPEDINIECGVSDVNDELLYYCFIEPALNSFNSALSEDRIKKGWEIKEKIKVKTRPINDILKEYLPTNRCIDFINVDIEGMEIQILKKFDFEKYAPKYFLIEDLENCETDLCNLDSELTLLLKSKNYYPVLKSKRTIIYAKRA